MHNLLRLIGRFRNDRRGNIAVIFAIACIPLITAVGCAVDYSMATRMKAKLQASADGAASCLDFPAISRLYRGRGHDGQRLGGCRRHRRQQHLRRQHEHDATGYQNLVRTSTVTKTGLKLTANVTYSRRRSDHLHEGRRLPEDDDVTGSSSASASLPPYLDFYLALDVSGSMGLPSTPHEAVRMQNDQPG